MRRKLYEPQGPAVVSFSGGRTSAFLLYQLVLGGLARARDVHVLFANTGKERAETLDFVAECARRWSVDVHWLEYVPGDAERKARYREVDFASASRAGEPFDALVEHRRRLPNPIMRICTQELKVRPMREWMKDRGYEHWTMIVGLRADEPRRVARMRALNDAGKERWETEMPLAEGGVTEADVLKFWRGQPFDLQLRTWEGNCDLCFLKSQAKKVRIIQDVPSASAWWEGKERELGRPFREGGRSYEQLREMAKKLPVLQPIAGAPDDLGDCLCTD